MINKRKTQIDKKQAKQYSFPYHYLPNANGFPNFCKDWGFSASYIAAIQLFQKWLEVESKGVASHQHIDYGCGDGGFIYHIKSLKKFDSVEFFGIDFDEKAIKWASLFSESDNFSNDDIGSLSSSKFDSGSLIEVYEHIPPNECKRFISCVAKSLRSGAPLFVTVPSTQKPLPAKHYRHFDFESLVGEFGEHFVVDEIYAFERKSFISKVINRLLKTKWWYLEIKFTNQYLINSYSAKHSNIKGCGRIGMVVRKK